MPKICYLPKRFNRSSQAIIQKANLIIDEYESQGFSLTLRQLYYQFVARDIIPNSLRSYKNLGAIINDARLAGLIDWNRIQDRTRYLRGKSHWDTPGDVIASAASSYHIDMWENQEWRPEVWIEKDALVGVVEAACSMLDVPFFSCRGYTSQSEMWVAAQRLKAYEAEGKKAIIFHFGDHDPSGKDMTRDIGDRLETFMGGVELKRMALNMDQIQKFKPPPNPAKITDSRAEAYIAEFGKDSWELDALEPKVITGLIDKAIRKLIDEALWTADEERLMRERELLRKTASEWDNVATFVTELED